MAPGKSTTKQASKLKSICPECDEEFVGTSCPDCGNTTGNQRIAPDGLRQRDHRRDNVFGNIDDLEGYSRTPDDVFLINVQNAKMASDEYTENLRQAQVMKSQLKRIEVEEQLLKRQAALERLKGGVVDTYPPEHPSQETPQASMGPLFGSQSPQAQFMSQLMKMNGDNRAEFISQLSDADPQALSTLSNMFVQPMQNQGGYPGSMNGMYPPPWMTPQQPQKDSTESSITLMKEMFGLMQSMQPKQDSSSNDLARDIKDELKALHNRIDSVAEKRPNNNSGENDAVVQYIKRLEQKIEESQYRPNFKEQAIELKDTIKALESIGLVNTTSSDTSIADKIQLKQLEHQMDMENKKFNLDANQAETNRSNQHTKEQLVKQLFTHGLMPHKPIVDSPQSSNTSYSPPAIHKPITISKPKQIVNEFMSDSGSVREVKESNNYNNEV